MTRHLSRKLLPILGVTAIVLAVTVGGIVAGALVVSPLATSLPWIKPAALALAGAAVAVSLASVLKRPPRLSRPSLVAVPSFTLPTMRLTGGARTPRAVQALAESGNTITEIARRTSLSVDAVSMLLSMATTARQLSPEPA